ncbi:MAG: hypothetical protein JSU63_08310, partial [Phycisphaerales bacterium]
SPEDLSDSMHVTGRVKGAVKERARTSEESPRDIVSRIVRDAPRAVFVRWLRDASLRRFYTDCRAAAQRADCDTPNELGDDS